VPDHGRARGAGGYSGRMTAPRVQELRVRGAHRTRQQVGRDPLPGSGRPPCSAEGQPGSKPCPGRSGRARTMEDGSCSRCARRRREGRGAADRGDRAWPVDRRNGRLSPYGQAGRPCVSPARPRRPRSLVSPRRGPRRPPLRGRAEELRAPVGPGRGRLAGVVRAGSAVGDAARRRHAHDRSAARRPHPGEHPRRWRTTRAGGRRPGALPRRPGVRRHRPRALARRRPSDRLRTRRQVGLRNRDQRPPHRRMVLGLRGDDGPGVGRRIDLPRPRGDARRAGERQRDRRTYRPGGGSWRGCQLPPANRK
jgi:hypothetical protein